MTGYDLSRQWFDYCFENPEKISPLHTAIYFFCIEHCNRLGWKDKFGLPSQMVMEAIGVKNWRTYSKGLNDLIDWGFIKLIEKSKNQYSSNIIAIVKNTKATTKALDKALQKHCTKHSQSIVSIDKQETIKQLTINKEIFDFSFVELDYKKPFDEWIEYKKDRKESYKSQKSILKFYNQLKLYANFNPEIAQEIVDKSMSNNWAGIFKPKTEDKQTKKEDARNYITSRIIETTRGYN